MYIEVNCTVRRGGDKVTGTNLMFSPQGQLVGTANKTILMGHENDHLQRANRDWLPRGDPLWPYWHVLLHGRRHLRAPALAFCSLAATF